MNMDIRSMVVCVGYADLLRRSLDRWLEGCERLTVVTSPDDAATLALCDNHDLTPFVTSIFYANGAKFNKGAALAQATLHTRWREGADWLLNFDADTVPPADWKTRLENTSLRPGTLYGAYRYQAPETGELRIDPTRQMPQGWVIGFFSLYHATDVHLPPLPAPLFDTYWPHAGNYDTTFTRRWPRDKQVILPIPMIHLGEERTHWCGRNKRRELRQFLNRRRGYEDWMREKMRHPPDLGEPPCPGPSTP